MRCWDDAFVRACSTMIVLHNRSGGTQVDVGFHGDWHANSGVGEREAPSLRPNPRTDFKAEPLSAMIVFSIEFETGSCSPHSTPIFILLRVRSPCAHNQGILSPAVRARRGTEKGGIYINYVRSSPKRSPKCSFLPPSLSRALVPCPSLPLHSSRPSTLAQ